MPLKGVSFKQKQQHLIEKQAFIMPLKGMNASISIDSSGADSIVCLLQFHNDPLAAVNACYEGDTVIICPGHYVVDGMFCIADSVELEGRRSLKQSVLN